MERVGNKSAITGVTSGASNKLRLELMRKAVKHDRFMVALVATGLLFASAVLASAQTASAPTGAQSSQTAPGAYQPKFPGDPARSESEAQALGYMRVVLRAESLYKKRHNKYAESLAALAGTGSFTKRMARSTERGDYTVSFRTNKDGYVLVMTPKQLDSEHRSFYAEEDNIIHADDQKAADTSSPRVK